MTLDTQDTFDLDETDETLTFLATDEFGLDDEDDEDFVGLAPLYVQDEQNVGLIAV
jgi:hypothetical protein